MIKIKQKGDFENLEKYLKKSVKITKVLDIENVANSCLERLIEATPVDTGLTAESWKYEIEREKNLVRIVFSNTNIQNGVNVALLLEYDHATANGGFVSGKNYIEPITNKAYLDALDKACEELKKL